MEGKHHHQHRHHVKTNHQSYFQSDELGGDGHGRRRRAAVISNLEGNPNKQTRPVRLSSRGRGGFTASHRTHRTQCRSVGRYSSLIFGSEKCNHRPLARLKRELITLTRRIGSNWDGKYLRRKHVQGDNYPSDGLFTRK